MILLRASPWPGASPNQLGKGELQAQEYPAQGCPEAALDGKNLEK